MALRIGRCLLSHLLQRSKMSQTELSIRSGVSKVTISHYVNNRRVMSLQNAKNIAAALKVTIDELYEWEFRRGE